MSEIAIHQLPAAGALTGTEAVPVDDGTATVRTSVAAIRAGLAAAEHGHGVEDVDGLGGALNARAPLTSPAFTGSVLIDGSVRVRQSGLYQAAFGETPLLQVSQQRGAQPAPAALFTWGNDAIGPRLIFGKSRGATVGTQAPVSANDELGGLYFCGSNGSSFNDVAASIGSCSDGAAGPSGNMPGRLEFRTTAAGSATPTERLRIASDGTIRHGSTTVVVDASSHVGLRSYTVTTLPSAAAAGRLIYVSNGSAGRLLAVSDGSVWRFPDGNTVS